MTYEATDTVVRGDWAGIKIDRTQLESGTLFQKIPMPMVLLDSDGHVCRVNQAANVELEMLVRDAVGGDIGFALRCVHSTQQSHGCGCSPSCEDCSLRDLITRTLETGHPHRQIEVQVNTGHNGERRVCHLLLSTAVVESPQGERILVCLEDITSRKRAELGLRSALQEVEQLKEQLQSENVSLREQVKEAYESEEIVGKSEEWKLTLEKAEYAAATDVHVLITGETGVGKDLIAQVIHRCSARKERPLIAVNCASLSSSLIESELFGHVAGAFTGAQADHAGRFELAHGSTIFLDEVAELAPELQAKLLRVLQHGQFERVGSSETRTVDVRVVAATNRDLHEAIAEGTFRSDLYYRLAVFPIEVPPLRARRIDIPLLVWHFITKMQARLGKRIESIPDAAMEALTQYNWPGNVRELKNVVERSVILSPGSTLQVADRLANPARPNQIAAPDDEIESIERVHITEVLEHCGWKINGDGNAADRLGLKPSTLRSRMKKLGIERPSRRPR